MKQTIYTKITTNKKYITDGIIVISFALFAFLFFIGKLQGNYPFVMLSSDAGNVASFTVGRQFPELFTNDYLLGTPSNFYYYLTVHIPLIALLGQFVGNYGLAYTWLLAPTIFIQLLGFYIFGRVLFQNRYWAMLLAIVSLPFVPLNMGEYWGIYLDAQPRFIFQAFLPLVLSATVYWSSKPNRWPWILMFAGFIMYAHPGNGPVWGLAIWLGLWPFIPNDWSIWKKVRHMFFIGIIFFITVSPFVIYYLQNHNASEIDSTLTYEQAYTMIRKSHTNEYFEPFATLKQFASILIRQGIFPLSIIGTIIAWKLNPRNHKYLILVGLWIMGIMIVCFVIPSIEQTIEQTYKILPIQFEIIRGIRYIVPIMLLLCLWPFVELDKKFKHTKYKSIPIVIGTFLVVIWVYSHANVETTKYISRALSCLRHGNLICVYENNWTDTADAIKAINRLTPLDASILTFSVSGQLDPQKQLAIRYYALRPVVYCNKDRAMFSYANVEKLPDHFQITEKLNAIRKQSDNDEKLKSLIILAKELEAQYLLVDFNFEPFLYNALEVTKTYANKTHTLIGVRQY